MHHKRLLTGLILAAVLSLTAAVALAATLLTYSTAPGLAIPDSGSTSCIPGTPGTPAVSEIVVNDTGAIQDLNVNLNIAHTWPGDLVVTLTHVETGTTVTLLNRPGQPTVNSCGTSVDNVAVMLDNSAAGDSQAASSVTGTLRPSGSLAAFNGQNIQGTWRLTVTDSVQADTGTLDSWGLQATVESNWTGWNPGDGRLNPEPAAPLAIYCDADSIYAYIPGYLEFDFPLDQIAPPPAPVQRTLVAENPDGTRLYLLSTGQYQMTEIVDGQERVVTVGAAAQIASAPAETILLTEGPTGARLYRLSTGELQVNLVHGGEEYVFTWDACPATITTTRVYDVATRALLSEFTRRP